MTICDRSWLVYDSPLQKCQTGPQEAGPQRRAGMNLPNRSRSTVELPALVGPLEDGPFKVEDFHGRLDREAAGDFGRAKTDRAIEHRPGRFAPGDHPVSYTHLRAH